MTLPIPPSIQCQTEAACRLITRVTGDTLRAIHLYGSAVAGGLKPNSDIDLLVTICQPLTETQRATLMQELLALSSPPGASAEKRALEVTVVLYSQLVPWCFPPAREMQFGEWLREDICQGIYEPAQQDWDIVLLITQILETSIPLKGERAERLFTPAPVAQLLKALRYPLDLWQSTADVQGDEYHIVLTLARIWYTLSTGRFTSKDAAADWLLQIG
ncbi:aminoglycoside adenylyltransferase family protein, partial [Salmonella enterica]|uniref:aminoglycoside adenylyltransferase family protein n=1 Tax=Salmonella enterica TaxID=28901 RepID=UPI0009AA4667